MEFSIDTFKVILPCASRYNIVVCREISRCLRDVVDRNLDPVVLLPEVVKNSCLKSVKFLLSHPRIGDVDMQDLLSVAIEFDQQEIARYLLKEQLATLTDKQVRVAIANNNIAMLDTIFSSIEGLSDDRFNGALFDAIQRRSHEMVRILMMYDRVDPTSLNHSALYEASRTGQHQIVELLMRDYRIDPSRDGNLALEIASENNHQRVIDALIRDSRVQDYASGDRMQRKTLFNIPTNISG